MNAPGRPLVTIGHADAPADWNDFVLQCEPAHFEQTSWWAGVESEDGWKSSYLGIRVAGRLLAGAMVLVRQQSRFFKVGYVVRGPLIRREESESKQVTDCLVSGLKDLARKQGLTLLVVVPPYEGAALASSLLESGFLKHPRSLPPTGLSPATITVDLRKGIDAVERAYRRTLRQEVNSARRKGVVVDLGTANDLGLFWNMHLQSCLRRGVATNVPSFDYLCRVWHEFSQEGRAWLFNARLASEVLCSLLCLGVGSWFYAWRIGWAPDSKGDHPTQVVFADAIRKARDAGFQFFDFMQIHPDDVTMLQRGERPTTPTAGVTFFKLGFGGSVRTLPPTLDWFPHPAVRLFMRVIGPRVFASGVHTRLIRWLVGASSTASARPRGRQDPL